MKVTNIMAASIISLSILTSCAQNGDRGYQQTNSNSLLNNPNFLGSLSMMRGENPGKALGEQQMLHNNPAAYQQYQIQQSLCIIIKQNVQRGAPQQIPSYCE